MKKVIVLLSMMGLLLAADFRFTASEETYNNQKIGQVNCYGHVIMRLLAKGEYQSNYARAQIVAVRLNESLKSLDDFGRIRLTYPHDIYTASVGGVKLVSVYPDEVAFNQSTPESLMSDWINNIKKAIAAGPRPNINVKGPMEGKSPTATASANPEKKLAKAPDKNEKIHPIKKPDDPKKADPKKKEPAKPAVATPAVTEAATTSNDATTDNAVVSGESQADITALTEKVNQLEGKIKKTKSGNKFPAVEAVLGANLLITILLILAWRKVRKQVGSLTIIEKTDQLEELENSVSVLIKELQDTSNTITDKAKAIVGELENKMTEAKNLKVTPMAPPTAAIPDVETRVAPPAPEPITAAMPEPMVEDSIDSVPVAEVIPEPVPEPVAEPIPEPVVVPEPEKSPAEELAEEIDKQAAEEVQTVAAESEPVAEPDDGMDPDLREELNNIINNANLTRNEKVVQLASINFMQEDIARFLDMGVGEVELILQLAK